MAEDEERYRRLMEKQITLKDTALGQQEEVFQRQMISSIPAMSEEMRRQMRKV